MRQDPRIRKDNRCAVCRKPIVVTVRREVPPQLYRDPFCSAACARSYFGVETSVPLPKGRVKYQKEEAAP